MQLKHRPRSQQLAVDVAHVHLFQVTLQGGV
jgi:hypothetical protein